MRAGKGISCPEGGRNLSKTSILKTGAPVTQRFFFGLGKILPFPSVTGLAAMPNRLLFLCFSEASPQNQLKTLNKFLPGGGLAGPGFPGPAEQRATIVGVRGEAWARSLIDPCGWDAERQALLPRTSFAADRIRQELGWRLRTLGFAVADPQRVGA